MRMIKKGATSQSIYIVILDSTSTTGGRKTGLVYNSSGLTAYYALNAGSATAITLATLAAANSAFSSGGFKEVDATNMPGVYRLDVPNAALTGADSVVISLKGVTGMVQVDIEIQLVAVDPQSANGFITGVNSIAPPTNWNLTSVDSNGRLDVIKVAGTTQTAGDIAARLPAALTSNGNMKSSILEWISTAFTEGATGRIATSIQTMFNVTSPVLTVQSVNQTGDNYARLGAPAGASVSADVAAVKTDSGNLINRLGAFTGSGINTVLGFLKAIMSKAASLTPSDVGGTFDNTLASLEALKASAATITDLGIINSTTLATLSTQISFTLTAGSANDNAYNGCPCIITNASTLTQKAIGFVDTYTGSTKTITLKYDPAIFTMAAGDGIVILPPQVSPAIKKAKAINNFEFAMIDATDDISGKTGLTVTAERSIDGAAFAGCSNSVTEVANGVYKINLSAADLNGNIITFKFTASGANATLITMVTEP